MNCLDGDAPAHGLLSADAVQERPMPIRHALSCAVHGLLNRVFAAVLLGHDGVLVKRGHCGKDSVDRRGGQPQRRLSLGHHSERRHQPLRGIRCGRGPQMLQEADRVARRELMPLQSEAC